MCPQYWHNSMWLVCGLIFSASQGDTIYTSLSASHPHHELSSHCFQRLTETQNIDLCRIVSSKFQSHLSYFGMATTNQTFYLLLCMKWSSYAWLILYFASSEACMICTLAFQVLKYSTSSVNISLHQPDLWQRENTSKCMNFVSKGNWKLSKTKFLWQYRTIGIRSKVLKTQRQIHQWMLASHWAIFL